MVRRVHTQSMYHQIIKPIFMCYFMHRCYSAFSTILYPSNVVSGRHHASWTAATGRVLLEPGAKLVMKLLHLVCCLSEFLGTRDKASVSCETKKPTRPFVATSETKSKKTIGYFKAFKVPLSTNRSFGTVSSSIKKFKKEREKSKSTRNK